MINKIRKELVQAGRYLAELGYVEGREGNLSARSEKGIVIKATNIFLERASSIDFSIMSLDGSLISGPQPSSEYRLHLEIYKRLPSINYVIHTHPTYSTALSYVEDGIDTITTESQFYLGKRVPVIPIIMPGTQELASAVTDVFEHGAVAVVMKAHGLVSVGEDMTTAVMRSIATERCAELTVLTRLLRSARS
ncbi:MAG: class II aldolase/adducin family protein [Nitrososphaerota archaeon]|nr:class II aldolase/adducin family protein [Nitrososphaerota archaeon]MDG7048137.1 class II aldolase/adducin family protein [Nitrososphaerota archaeon]MDG7049454.1 class II aldolase/adducin family protein [Nitrososphaerota archaeon]MDG7051703.1 class II aldolase/adducin family protein [Nitrososphaerota archaeon]